MEIIKMPNAPNSMKTVLILAACIGLAWKAGSRWWGPAVEPGKVAMLTSGNFYEVKKSAGTLIAIYMHPG
jgi:hypothetical protein